VLAEFGNYITPQVEAGYSGRVGDYLVDVAGNVEASSGWLEGAQYLQGGVSARSTYVAPDKFLVFGGSTTTVDAGVNTRNYKVFAARGMPDRSVLSLNAGLETTGAYEGVGFNAGLAWRNTAITDSTAASYADGGLFGTASVGSKWGSINVGADVDLRLPAFRGNAYPYTAAGLRAAATGSSIAWSLSAAGQWSTTTFGASRVGLLAQGALHLFLSENFTLDAILRSGLRPLAVQDMLAANPYLADTLSVDVPYDVVDAAGTMRFHPTIRFTLAGGLGIRATDRDLVWAPADSGRYVPTFVGTTTVRLFGNTRWLASAADAVIADLVVSSASLSGGGTVPYVPLVQASVGYERDWTEALRSNVYIVYVGERYTSTANTAKIPGYVDARLGVSYALIDQLDLHLRAENLMGNTMVVWDGYRERGVFVSLGLTWRF
jgi:hypothetical protein